MCTSVLRLSCLAFAALALTACGSQPEPEPEPTEAVAAEPQTPVTDRVSEADKAAVDALGTDVEKLLTEYNQATGVRQEYALFRLSAAMVGNSEGIEMVEKSSEPWSPPWRAAKEARTAPQPSPSAE